MHLFVHLREGGQSWWAPRSAHPRLPLHRQALSGEDNPPVTGLGGAMPPTLNLRATSRSKQQNPRRPDRKE